MGGINMLISICGKSGSGKSTTAKMIIEMVPNSIHCDVDKIGHESLTLTAVKEQLIKIFGEEVVVNGNVDRKKLGSLVFNSKDNMEKLSDITWPYMEEIIDNFINKNADKNVILDWILLPMTKYFNMSNIKILVDIPLAVRKERVLRRDNISEESFNAREKASIQYNNDEFDFIIKNNNLEKVRKLVKRI
jgi:dephospho-CoA kinase